VLSKKTADDLRKENERYKLGLEDDYKDYIQFIENELSAIATESSVDKKIKSKVNSLLLSALSYKPKERPAMKDLVVDMKKFEQENNIKIKYAETEVINNKNLIINESDLGSKVVYNKDIIKKEKEVFIEPEYKMCSCYNRVVYAKARLGCSCFICKNCLIQNVLRSFLKGKPYGQSLEKELELKQVVLTMVNVINNIN
jgi:hypothetical protein